MATRFPSRGGTGQGCRSFSSPTNRLRRQMETGSSTVLRWQAPSQGAGQMRPSTAGRAISRFTTFRDSSHFPAAISLFISGMFIWAGQPIWQGASQSPTCSLNSSSRAICRPSLISSSSVMICMWSVAFTEQEGKSFPLPSFTRQSIQEVKWSSSLCRHKAGIWIPAASAAFHTELPSGTSTS